MIFSHTVFAENLNIQSLSISIDKNSKVSIFKNEVIASDEKNNILKTNYAEYNKDLEILKSIGETTIITSEKYTLS